MINRVLIRIKVVQMVYSYFLTEKYSTENEALKELERSLNKAYELYFYLLLLPIELTRIQEMRIDTARNKFLPTDEDKNPNTRFIENKFVATLSENEKFNSYLNDNPISWQDDVTFTRNLLNRIIESEPYKEYMNAESTDYESDCELWRRLFKSVILQDADLEELLEQKSVYWNDDLDIMGTFVTKTIKKFQDFKDGENSPILPMYKDREDATFAGKLFADAVKNEKKYHEIIDKFIKNWDFDRIPLMDIVILTVAISELLNFESVPTRVTMNEYIEIAKTYSHSKSAVFVNGILNSIIEYFKTEKMILKD